jgi:RNAse (barnase) inhibitor barstar
VRNKQGLMTALAARLDFPDYFGANWDALADCLTDFGWAPARGYVVRLTGLAGLARRPPRNFAILLDVLEDAAQVWAAEGAAFYVLLDNAKPVPGKALPQVTAA